MEANLVIRFTTGRTKTEPPAPQITLLLDAWRAGSGSALNELVPMVEAELRRLARGYLRRERPGHVLQTTALVNEAFVRLVGWQEVKWQNRAHFIAMAAQLMRHILVDIARRARSADGPVCWWSISLTPSRPSRTAPEI